MHLSDRTLSDWLEYWAAESPDKEYIVYSDRNLRFSWKTFNERVDNMAKGLIAIGVTRLDECRDMGAKCTRLADFPLCYRQNRCCCCHGKHKLQIRRSVLSAQEF